VAGMKPTITCAQCGSALQRTVEHCPSCGTQVDWTGLVDVAGPVAKSDARGKDGRGNTSRMIFQPKTWSSKTIVGVIALVALLIVIYAVFFERRPNTQTAQQQQSILPMNAPVQIPSDIQELENSLAANPDDMSLTLQLANALHDRQLYEQAVPYYKTYLMMNPKDANARVDMGICYKELGSFTEAEGQMKMALHYAPNHLFAHFNLGIVYLSEGNLEEANKWFKKTVALDPASEVGKRAQQLLAQHNSQPITQ
jgi:thioredoxin-like negative regulator of GroEL